MTSTQSASIQSQAHNDPIPLYYTFGNHMHWVDMEWLWGYNVMPNSTRDMLHFCHVTGAKGNVNFDGIGYEKLAVEAPDALAELRGAVQQGQIEIVGSSYGQPYGLFHGGESNVRQRVYGVRSAMRLLGKRPCTFWEEEFDFFPQLPQMLNGVGFQYASLFFQWTWHTPEVPRENLPSIWWQGIDGSQLLTAPRNALNLHQWPEDFKGLLDSPLLREMPIAGIVQWLELMPSPDWMCRSELLLPQLLALKNDPRFDLRFVTLSEYLEQARPFAEIRHYTMDDVFHGMSLGKNGDLFRRLSRSGEDNLLAAESLSAMMGLFGRPYPHWEVYPTWELEEAWRDLLSAQHHDNDECEGLCGHVGKLSYQRSLSLSQLVTERAMRLLAKRVGGKAGDLVAYNPLGWARQTTVISPKSGMTYAADLPSFGYVIVSQELKHANTIEHIETENTLTLKRGALSVTVDRRQGVITQITSVDFPDGLLDEANPLCALEMTVNGSIDQFQKAETAFMGNSIFISRMEQSGKPIWIQISFVPDTDAVDVHYSSTHLDRPDGTMGAALKTCISINLPGASLIHDTPYAVSEIRAEGKYLKKYPTGEWMTSPQVFEEVINPFTAYSLLDFDNGERGLLYLHDGSQAMFRAQSDTLSVQNILSMYDPWDEDYFVDTLDAHVRFVPHGKIDHARRWKLAQEFRRPALVVVCTESEGYLPSTFSPILCDNENVAITAFYRETEENALGLDSYAGAGMGFPYILRLVELNGEATKGKVSLPGKIASAYRTNLMGEIVAPLAVQADEFYNYIELDMRPHDIATIYVDLEMGRKMPRNLDAYRFVWATIHRTEEHQSQEE